ncbi:Uncharacterised protein [Bordetella pertussis]|nr:Uncharacterised protein [Bordetella pertussis]
MPPRKARPLTRSATVAAWRSVSPRDSQRLGARFSLPASMSYIFRPTP